MTADIDHHIGERGFQASKNPFKPLARRNDIIRQINGTAAGPFRCPFLP